MRYFKARLTEKNQELIYRIYLTDSVYALGNNKRVNKRYYDIYTEMKHPQKVETRSGEEVIAHLKEKMSKLKG